MVNSINPDSRVPPPRLARSTHDPVTLIAHRANARKATEDKGASGANRSEIASPTAANRRQSDPTEAGGRLRGTADGPPSLGGRDSPHGDATPLAPSGGADPRQNLEAAFAALKAEGPSPSAETMKQAKDAAVGLVKAAIRQGRPDYISGAREALGEAEFNRQFESLGLNARYAAMTERILSAAKAGDAKALQTIKTEVDEALKQGDLRYGNANAPLTPLWHAADAIQRCAAAGRPCDIWSVARGGGGLQAMRRWLDGADAPAKAPPPDALEIAMAAPAHMVAGLAESFGQAWGDLQALHDGPVRTADGGVHARDGADGREQMLYRNRFTGEDMWLDAKDPARTLAERGTVALLASLGAGAGPMGASLSRRWSPGRVQAGKFEGLAESLDQGKYTNRAAFRVNPNDPDGPPLVLRLSARDTPQLEAHKGADGRWAVRPKPAAARDATPDDVKVLHDVITGAGNPAPLVTDRTAWKFAADNTTLATVDGEVVGGVFALPLKEGEFPATFGPTRQAPWAKDHFYIDSLWVAPNQRGAGRAAQLLREVEARAKRANCRAMSLEVYAKNVDALNLYRKQGFKTMKEYVDGHGDVILYMVREL